MKTALRLKLMTKEFMFSGPNKLLFSLHEEDTDCSDWDYQPCRVDTCPVALKVPRCLSDNFVVILKLLGPILCVFIRFKLLSFK